MSIKQLSQASAYNPGSSLWVMPNREKSKWTHKTDWYLNFQFSRSLKHTKEELSQDVIYILDQTDLTLTKKITTSKEQFLIPANLNLPCRWVLICPYKDNISDWCLKIKETWTSLTEPSLRIFLPTGLSSSEFSESWRAHSNFDDLTVVLD